ncbi:VOC family protein [Marinicrinis sediminis]|uniref:VOC family protein n=1 Tax=Marinicrinis sediminis TaxID=1652465 RepID=A0ABW5R566_9BACL
MKLIGIRYVDVVEEQEKMAAFFEKQLGLGNAWDQQELFQGSIYKAGDSWMEFWQKSDQMPAGAMLQLIVDDANAFAEHARQNGLSPHGPVTQHGEIIYYLTAPNGMPVTLQSKA